MKPSLLVAMILA